MVGQKRGWIRILEATIAVMLISGVLIILYAQQTQNTDNVVIFIENLQTRILKDISTQESLRNYVLSEDITELNKSVGSYVPSHLGYSIKVCNLSLPCKLDSSTFKETLSKDVIADSTIIASNITQYTPKKVMVFMWYR